MPIFVLFGFSVVMMDYSPDYGFQRTGYLMDYVL
jgi:hypothetical protein